MASRLDSNPNQSAAFRSLDSAGWHQRVDGYLPIESYALIGDCRTAALVGSDGSIDWFCWPRFDSPPIFNRLLDASGGYFSLAPTGGYTVTRSYRQDSNVLVTKFEVEGGSCQVTDLLAAIPQEARRRMLLPETLIIRRIEGLTGMVPMDALVQAQSGFNKGSLDFRYTDKRSVVSSLTGRHLLHVAAEAPLSIDQSVVQSHVEVRAGESFSFAVSLTADEPAVFPPLDAIGEMIELTDGYWRQWASKCKVNVPNRDLVVRSALVLKLLSSSPSGAIMASPTTSLPEVPGGDKNWDYRYCWLRDASLTVRAFLDLGYEDEARAFTQWMLHATRLTRPKLQVLYDTYGRQPSPERMLEELNGYRGAKPVRVGNEAGEQVQLDVYGEVVDAVAACYGSADHLSRDERLFVQNVVKYIIDHGREPDNGIWELRGARKHYVDSKVMSWLALERAAQLSEKRLIKMDVDHLRSTASTIRELVRTRGYSSKLNGFRQVLDEDALDAAALRMPIVGFCPATDPLMSRTIDAIVEHLARGELVYRRDEEKRTNEGAFVACSFWLVDCLARQGRQREATKAFELLLARSNDVGLYSEEIDASTGSFLGNFPLGFSHTALINAAVTIGKEGRRA